MKIENRMQLHLWREECKEKRQKETCRVLICGEQDVWQAVPTRSMPVLRN